MSTSQKGFVTIATGRVEFFIMARNLLLSYRHSSKNPLPFAIICDKQNKYTECFDDVVVMPSARKSYIDKLALTSLTPYEKTIFVDADCLAYRDLNDLWDVFEGAPAFCALGHSYPVDYDKGWFVRGDVGEFASRVQFCVNFHGGVYYIDKAGEGLEEFGKTVSYINEHYLEYKFRLFPKPADEPIFALACSVHGFAPRSGSSFWVCFLPSSESVEADFSSGDLNYSFINESSKKKEVKGAYLLHWGHHRHFWLFLKQSFEMLSLVSDKKTALKETASFWLAAVFYRLSRIIKKLFPYKIKRTVFIVYEHFSKLR